MKWLAQLHQDWMAARKRRVTASVQPFRRDWEQLLEDAGIKSAEDQQAALREAQRMPKLRLLPRKRNPRYIDKILIPLESEAWLHAQFGSQPGAASQQQALEIVQTWAAKTHPLLPELWQGLCQRLESAFTIPRVLEPFRWLEVTRVNDLLSLLFQITSREWPAGTLIRDASTQLGHDSKHLEEQQSFLERALEALFERETPLEALGIQTSNSTLHYCGPLVLHFEDHVKPVDLRFESTLSAAELERATHITTSAERLLTVENRKTTFLQLAHADEARSTLIVATSFPTQAVKLLLQKLPSGLPHHHFGDTDPSGWDILRRLREIRGNPVHPFHMAWRHSAASAPLTRRDLQIIDRLLADSCMSDCRTALHAMKNSGMKGDFEQESLGRPSLSAWPFYEALGCG
ncbi:Wadjet anti-phage system protein JetD domain-containing protein [Prosthecobacter sp.]|uniref:Wadjet anti-phage system protein JetD domain-containing protein n=1 Tax=Prosthecobacter sp. TaxID=1965333 RepID=UPI003784E12B